MPSNHHHFSYRLRGIPLEIESRAQVRKLVKQVLSIESRKSLKVYSLAVDPVHSPSKTATLSFETPPTSLSDSPQSLWSFDMPANDPQEGLSDEEGQDLHGQLVFDSHFSGFTPLHRTGDDECKADVIVLTGLGGHPIGSFKERGGTFVWIRDALVNDFPEARIFTYGYNTEVKSTSSFQNLTDLGDKPRAIIFMGHSLGGLVIKEAIINLKYQNSQLSRSILQSVSGFLFFGVPNEGMENKSLVALVKDQPNQELLVSLGKNSALLPKLNVEFPKSFPKCPEIVAFYETKRSPTAVVDGNEWKLSGPEEILVDRTSATRGSTRNIPIDLDHSEMVKYSLYDKFYTRVRTALKPLFTTEQVISMEVGSDRNQQCLRSFSFKEQESRYHGVHRAQDTCNWLLDDPKYQAWMNESQGLYWIKGNPGAGKSVVMKFAVETMTRRRPEELVVKYFIHGHGTSLQQTLLGVYRALLSCLLSRFTDYLAKITETQFAGHETELGSYKFDEWSWSEDELEGMLSELLTNWTKNRPVVIFVDALDECGEISAKRLLTFFRDVMEEIEREGASVKICFSSRHYPIIGHDTVPSTIVEEHNDQDIRLYARN
ncbi:hypothetical protein CDD80_5828 [Ophiocordyceps camponoti-rufipedis]|uniref:Nephrocystin 3-like N-terminal domain-containing protein n=1 Tax=Ophiocordyceps camponoti-rufipedis TaxID=2004952 RepID=A0A2C5YS43_9HYPO|nr:hypothetical protein CDD80_5828 [Ophiocordyceps camponoti-rufipedis]